MDLTDEHRGFSFSNKNEYSEMMDLIKEGGDDFVSAFSFLIFSIESSSLQQLVGLSCLIDIKSTNQI